MATIETEDRSLSVIEIPNPSATATLLFIHGACSSGKDWDTVTPHLRDKYHILLPDLPHHGGSSEIAPFTIDTTVWLLAKVIHTQAINGKAHIIGLSLGAHVAVALASAHPHLADTVFVSGYKNFPSMAPETLARGLWLESRIMIVVPRSWLTWAMDGTDFPAVLSKPSLQLCREIATPLNSDKDRLATLSPWAARTLIIAAGKADWLPTADSPDDAKALRDFLIDAQDGKTRAVTHMQMRHPWNRQRPELFADAVKAWIEDGRVIEGFDEL